MYIGYFYNREVLVPYNILVLQYIIFYFLIRYQNFMQYLCKYIAT